MATPGSAEYVTLVLTLTFLVGVFQLLGAQLHLGFHGLVGGQQPVSHAAQGPRQAPHLAAALCGRDFCPRLARFQVPRGAGQCVQVFAQAACGQPG